MGERSGPSADEGAERVPSPLHPPRYPAQGPGIRPFAVGSGAQWCVVGEPRRTAANERTSVNPAEQTRQDARPSTPTSDELAHLVDVGSRLTATINAVVEGKADVVSTAVTVLLAEGHLLVEDVPGVGKTMLAKTLARAIDASVRRIQFTPDLLPSDITGVSIFNQDTHQFVFRPGAVFANVVVGDEINRASPKAQSALLECMDCLLYTSPSPRD